MTPEVQAERERCLSILSDVEKRYTPDGATRSIYNAPVEALREAGRRILSGESK